MPGQCVCFEGAGAGAMIHLCETRFCRNDSSLSAGPSSSGQNSSHWVIVTHHLHVAQVPKGVKAAIHAATQAGRRDVLAAGVHGNLFPQSTAVAGSALWSAKAGKRPKQSTPVPWQRKQSQAKMTQFGNKMTEKRASAIHQSRVTTMAALGQSPSEAASNWENRHAELATPGMKFYPLQRHSITDKFLPILQSRCEVEQMANMHRQPVDLLSTVAIDGLKVGHDKILIASVSTGLVDTLAKLDSAVGEDATDTSRSVKVVMRVIKQHISETGRQVALVSTDNAETKSCRRMASETTKLMQLTLRDTGLEPVDCTVSCLTGRDASHTVELLATDFNKLLESLKEYFKEVKSLITWTLMSAVLGFRTEVLNDNPDLKLETGGAPGVPLNEMRQLYNEIMLEGNNGDGGVLGNMPCYLVMVQTAAFENMVDALPQTQRKRYKRMIRLIQSNSWFRKGQRLANILRPIHICTQTLSNSATPMSAVFPLIYALQEELHLRLVDEADEFNSSFGDDAAEVLMNAVNRRFNLDGEAPTNDREPGQRGRAKVPILDKYHLYAWLMDPHAAKLGFDIELPHGQLHQAMIEQYTTYHDPEDLTSSQKEAIASRRVELAQEAMAMHQRTGAYSDPGLGLAPWRSNPGVKPTVLAVSAWINETGAFDARLGWYSYWKPTSLLYQQCARPLMSMRSVMSMTCERFAKPLKHVIYGLNRHNTSVAHAETLLKCHLMLKMQMQGSIDHARVDAQARVGRARADEQRIHQGDDVF